MSKMSRICRRTKWVVLELNQFPHSNDLTYRLLFSSLFRYKVFFFIVNSVFVFNCEVFNIFKQGILTLLGLCSWGCLVCFQLVFKPPREHCYIEVFLCLQGRITKDKQWSSVSAPLYEIHILLLFKQTSSECSLNPSYTIC